MMEKVFISSFTERFTKTGRLSVVFAVLEIGESGRHGLGFRSYRSEDR